MKVLIADAYEQGAIRAIEGLGCDVRCDPSLGTDALADAIAGFGAEVLVVRSTRVPAPVIHAARGLRLIIRGGAGYDNIDSQAAGSRGIGVCNCPGMNADAVAELAIGLLLCCDRRIADQTAELRSGTWNKMEYSRARGLKGEPSASLAWATSGERQPSGLPRSE